jgi:hypothetical protein
LLKIIACQGQQAGAGVTPIRQQESRADR